MINLPTLEDLEIHAIYECPSLLGKTGVFICYDLCYKHIAHNFLLRFSKIEPVTCDFTRAIWRRLAFGREPFRDAMSVMHYVMSTYTYDLSYNELDKLLDLKSYDDPDFKVRVNLADILENKSPVMNRYGDFLIVLTSYTTFQSQKEEGYLSEFSRVLYLLMCLREEDTNWRNPDLILRNNLKIAWEEFKIKYPNF